LIPIAGVLLEGMDGLTPEFDAWLIPERQRLDALAGRALQRLAGNRISPKERTSGIAHARRMLARDPTREPPGLESRRGEAGRR